MTISSAFVVFPRALLADGGNGFAQVGALRRLEFGNDGTLEQIGVVQARQLVEDASARARGDRARGRDGGTTIAA